MLAVEYSDNEALNEIAEKAIEAVNAAIAGTTNLTPQSRDYRWRMRSASRTFTNARASSSTTFTVGVENEAYFDVIEKERPNFFVAISRARSRLMVAAVNAPPHT